MNFTYDMLRSHPSRTGVKDERLLTRTIETLTECAIVCSQCADACLAEPKVEELRNCIRLNLVCADVCAVTARALAQPAEESIELAAELLHACVTACRLCGAECRRHAHHHEHCRVCAECCQKCKEACASVQDIFSVTV